MTTHVDVVIASLPFVETNEPLMAPAILKSIATKANLSSKTFDLNLYVNLFLKNSTLNRNLKEKITKWFLYDEFKNDHDVKNVINNLANEYVELILSYNPKWICLSLFCKTAKAFNVEICKKIKTISPTTKIVIGGNAVYTDEKTKRPYGKILEKAKLIDYYVVGDGEEPLFNILTEKTKKSFEEFQVLEDLNNQVYPDYSDYEWDNYELKRVPMYGSRGCVRRCTFCDVYKLWKKFKIRTSQDVFDEMLYQSQKTGISNFYFRDSLINGSMSEYRELISLIADYNNKNENKINWTCFFIFRPKNQMTEKDWELTSKSGAYNLVVGMESFVERIRYHMRKKFSNDDVEFGLEMAFKYNVTLTFLLIMGYVSETEEDFKESLNLLKKYSKYKEVISALGVGGTLTLTDLSDLYQHYEIYDIELGDKIYSWKNKTTGLDYETRINRKKLFIEEAIKLGYNIGENEKPVE